MCKNAQFSPKNCTEMGKISDKKKQNHENAKKMITPKRWGENGTKFTKIMRNYEKNLKKEKRKCRFQIFENSKKCFQLQNWSKMRKFGEITENCEEKKAPPKMRKKCGRHSPLFQHSIGQVHQVHLMNITTLWRTQKNFW